MGRAAIVRVAYVHRHCLDFVPVRYGVLTLFATLLRVGWCGFGLAAIVRAALVHRRRLAFVPLAWYGVVTRLPP